MQLAGIGTANTPHEMHWGHQHHTGMWGIQSCSTHLFVQSIYKTTLYSKQFKKHQNLQYTSATSSHSLFRFYFRIYLQYINRHRHTFEVWREYCATLKDFMSTLSFNRLTAKWALAILLCHVLFLHQLPLGLDLHLDETVSKIQLSIPTM